jgi:glucokinase
MPSLPFDSPRLLADIGSTYARFALETGPGTFASTSSLRCADFKDFYTTVCAYLGELRPDLRASVKHAAIAIANPVIGDQVRMTNYHWQFSIEQMREKLGLDNLVVVNDFTALAMALPSLSPTQRRQVGGGSAVTRSVIGLIGAGSGLGVSGLIPANDGWVALGTEGGHASFSPHDERELAILQYAWRDHPHVSFERLVSASGIELIYNALADHQGCTNIQPLEAAEITQRAMDNSDSVCTETMEVFCGMLGTAAANLAVTQGAFGGIYLGGGIVPRLGKYFDHSSFRQRFEDKGRFSDYVRKIPTFVITAEDATLIGVSVILASQLRNLDSSGNSPILGQILRVLGSLSPAEQRVANFVLAHPRSTVNDPIVQIAQASEVSQPTVIRFCRSLGCTGLSDFKLRLASSLTGTMPITHTQVTGQDTMLELGVKVLGNTASAILQLRDHLNRESIDRAVQLMAQANRVEVYAVGHYGAAAEDAQLKFMHIGLPSSAYTSDRLLKLAADLLTPQDVALIISNSGSVSELLEVADKAHARGTPVIAITSSQSPLARKADLALIVDQVEDAKTQIPMISRILHLLMIDILVVGVSLRNGSKQPAAINTGTANFLDETQAVPTHNTDLIAPGVMSARSLTHLTSIHNA